MSEEEKAIQFYKKFIDAEEKELEWMYKNDEEFYKDDIEQKELLIKGWKNILNLITKLQKENKKKDIYIKHSEDITKEMNEDINKLLSEIKEKDKQIDELVKYIDSNNYVDNEECQFQWDFKIEKCAGNGDCKECIKQYFEKLAKEEGE